MNERARWLVVCDPTLDLPGAGREASSLIRLGYGAAAGRLDLAVTGGERVERLLLLDALARADVLHYAGHAVVDATSGEAAWRLRGAPLRASDVLALARAPRLVFAHACATDGGAAGGEDGLAGEGVPGRPGLGQAFVRAGARNAIGTLWDVSDGAGPAVAVAFYEALLRGGTVGEALRAGRQVARASGSPRDVTFASYVLFGDPRERPLGVVAQGGAGANA